MATGSRTTWPWPSVQPAAALSSPSNGAIASVVLATRLVEAGKVEVARVGEQPNVTTARRITATTVHWARRRRTSPRRPASLIRLA